MDKNVTLLHFYDFSRYSLNFLFSEIVVYAYQILHIHTGKYGNAKIHIKD